MDAETQKKIDEIKQKIAEQKVDMENVDPAHYIFQLAKIYKEKKMKKEAIEFFNEANAKTQSFNTKVDSLFEILHIGLMEKDDDLISEYLLKCQELVKTASDWEKKNRLKVYEGLVNILNKNFKDAGKLFLEALMTFTSYELFDYKTFVFYTAITNIITLDRTTLKKRVIDNSDVVSCINDIPHLEKFLNSFYEGRYKEFLIEFYAIIQRIKTDFFFAKHVNFYINEMRIKVYSQFLQSYRTVAIDNMANVFGVSPKFIDNELSNFIAQGRINAKIDKVSGIIECSQEEQSVDLYRSIIHKSDLLVNKIHKLSKLLEL